MIRKQKVVVKDNMGLPNYMTAFIWEGSQTRRKFRPCSRSGARL